MALAVVRTLRSPRQLHSADDLEAFEQELVDRYALASSAVGITDHEIGSERYILFEFLRFLNRPLWTACENDADRFLVRQRKELAMAPATVTKKAWALAAFYDFLMARYQGEVFALTGFALVQPIDEFNRPPKPNTLNVRIPPSDQDVEALFSSWRAALPGMRKYLPAARDYLAASLWRRAGLRITETTMLDIGDWRPDLGELGKLHVRFGKGSHSRGPKARLVPGINDIGDLIEWWLTDVRHQFGDDWDDPHAPLMPSERRDPRSGRCKRIQPNALRQGLNAAVEVWLPHWIGLLTPHTLRHYCASSLYARGLDLKAIQELLGHSWLSTTTTYIHVHANHIEHSWAKANERTMARLAEIEG